MIYMLIHKNALASALRLRKIAHEKNIPVIVTTVTYDPKGITGGVFFKKAKPLTNFLPNSPTAGWPKGLKLSDQDILLTKQYPCLLYTSPSPRDQRGSRMPSSA